MVRGISIHIGVNQAATMRGRPLSRSEHTAWKMAELAHQAGYRAIHVVCGAEATRDAVGAQLACAARALRPRETLFVTFSGHGSRVRDKDGDERDHLDETWCLHDADLLDDELAKYWRLLPPGARVLVVSDSCFAAGGGREGNAAMAATEASAAPRRPVYRSVLQTAQQPPSSCIERAPENNDGIAASILILAAANEARQATEGIYIDRLLKVWDGGAFRGSFCDLHHEVCRLVRCEGYDQDPQILMLGTADETFPLEVAFHLERGPVMRGQPEMPEQPVMRGGPVMRGRGGGF